METRVSERGGKKEARAEDYAQGGSWWQGRRRQGSEDCHSYGEKGDTAPSRSQRRVKLVKIIDGRIDEGVERH